ncbi:hypothetical protein BU23DRAFT_659115 [Bimuria novae-zelandiae CBS 107.79]|uniref:Uncharacterized protein n=1 Tax=Bimuria novae-zelandiae CBS 107.79 TaxID=1447943 RepID=A0A6A5UQM0_9PLEO|nr:hypothetical protein BU23DRAFT_659115 [Bimuria novae-zelandiae CBS 107.79]
MADLAEQERYVLDDENGSRASPGHGADIISTPSYFFCGRESAINSDTDNEFNADIDTDDNELDLDTEVNADIDTDDKEPRLMSTANTYKIISTPSSFFCGRGSATDTDTEFYADIDPGNNANESNMALTRRRRAAARRGQPTTPEQPSDPSHLAQDEGPSTKRARRASVSPARLEDSPVKKARRWPVSPSTVEASPIKRGREEFVSPARPDTSPTKKTRRGSVSPFTLEAVRKAHGECISPAQLEVSPVKESVSPCTLQKPDTSIHTTIPPLLLTHSATPPGSLTPPATHSPEQARFKSPEEAKTLTPCSDSFEPSLGKTITDEKEHSKRREGFTPRFLNRLVTATTHAQTRPLRTSPPPASPNAGESKADGDVTHLGPLSKTWPTKSESKSERHAAHMHGVAKLLIQSLEDSELVPFADELAAREKARVKNLEEAKERAKETVQEELQEKAKEELQEKAKETAKEMAKEIEIRKGAKYPGWKMSTREYNGWMAYCRSTSALPEDNKAESSAMEADKEDKEVEGETGN